MQEKSRRREEVKVRKASEPASATSGDEDPDIAGIIPGPQPRPWEDDDLIEETPDEEKTEGN
jgi:hypothetical protein